MIMPLLPPADRSVLTDWLEREVPTNRSRLRRTHAGHGGGLARVETFRLGSASVNGFPDSKSKGGNPSGPGLDFYRFVQGAQGTMGVVTWTNMKIECMPRIDKIFFAPVDDLDFAIDFFYRILPRRIGQECLLLNNVDLAAILAEKWPSDFERLAATLPPWTLILVISGLLRRPEEKIAYEEKFLTEVLRNEFRDLVLTDTLPGFPGAARKLLPMLRNPWPAEFHTGKTSGEGHPRGSSLSPDPRCALFLDVVETLQPGMVIR